MRNDINFLEKEDIIKEYKIRKIKFRTTSFDEINNKWQNYKFKDLEQEVDNRDKDNYPEINLVKKVYKSNKLKNDVNAIETEWGSKKVIKSKPLTVKDKMYNGFLYNSSNLFFDDNVNQDNNGNINIDGNSIEIDSTEIEKTVSDAFSSSKEEKIISPEEVKYTISGSFDNIKVSKNESGKAKIDKYSNDSYEVKNENNNQLFKITDIEEENEKTASNDTIVFDNKFSVNNDIFGTQEEQNKISVREIPVVAPERKIIEDNISSKLFEIEISNIFDDAQTETPDNSKENTALNNNLISESTEEGTSNYNIMDKVSDILESVKKLEEQKEEKREKAEIAKKKAAEKEEEKRKALEELISYKDSLTADIKEIEDIERINIEKASNDDKIIGDIYSTIGTVKKFAE